ncbi:MAG: hypothetical protein MAG581_01330 [Deltaproteobacteria bacterium]|jgi:hypothetical protein|nr:hypothetical protein [Deltaproteobacteria bacterium]
MITVLLGAIVLSGCSEQKVYVYEKLPEANECRRYTDYFKISDCNRKHHFIMSKKLYRAMQITNYRLRRKFNQKDKCKEKTYRPAPAGCYVTHLPSRANIPTFGKTAD